MTRKARIEGWLESLPAEAATLDHDGTILSVNEHWKRFARANGFWGSRHGVGENYIAVCHAVVADNEYAGAAGGLERVLAGVTDHFELEYPFQTRDGTRWYRLTATPLPATGRRGALVMHFDITSARWAGEELRATEQKLARMADEVPVGIFHTDASGGCLYVNQRWCEMTGMTAEEAMGDGWATALHPDDREWLFRAWKESATTGEPFRLEYRFRHRDGRTLWVNGSATALRDSGGSVVGYLGSVTDVTPRKEAEAENRQAHEQLEAIVTACPLPIVGVDPDGHVLMWNPAAERVFGWKAEEVLGVALPVVPPEKQEEFQRWKTSVLGGGGVTGVETYRLHRDGSRIEVSLSTAALASVAGEPTGAVAVYTDITARKQVERELERSREELRHAQKIEAVGRLAGGVAHDFNNMLTAILSYCDLLLAECVEPASGMVREIQEAATRAADLTRQLLAYGRRQIFLLEIVDINDVVRGLEAMLRGVAGDGVELVLNLTPKPARVYADHGQLEQVLVNLAVNARDAMTAGGRLEVRTEVGSRKGMGETVALCVSDTGIGMDEETMARLFEPFFTTKQSGKRRGLGLATSHGIVEQLGGKIAIESTPGAGSTFAVLLPLESRREPRPAGAMAERPADVPANKVTVLVVDDERNVREAVSKILTRVGYTVLVAASGSEALQLVRGRAPQLKLVLTDVVMSGMGGVELAWELRKEMPDVKVLLMSGYSESEVLRHGVRTQTMTLLRKPFTMEELVQAVGDSLRPA